MAAKISIRELARRLNLSDNSVRRAISDQKVSDCFDPVAKKFDWKKAQKNEWVQSAGVIKPQRGVSTAKAIEKHDRAEKTEVNSIEKKTTKGNSKNNIQDEIPSAQIPEEEGENIDELSEEELADRIKLTDTMTVQQAMRAKEIINAAIDKIKLKQLQAVLVPKSEVEKAYYSYAAQLKKALLQLPDIIGDELLAASNKVEAMNILKKGLTEVLEEYSKAPEIQNG